MDRSLYIAASEGQVDVLRQYINQLEIQTTANRNTVLHVAAQFNQLQCLAAILEVCPSLLRGVNIKGETPLHMAAREGYNDIVKVLIECAKKREQLLESGLGGEAKKMLRATNVDKDTALHMAVRNDHSKKDKYLEVIKLLTEEDREFEHPANNYDETPLYLAAERGSVDVVEMLLKTCTSLTYGGPSGRTALHATTFNNSKTAHLRGATVNFPFVGPPVVSMAAANDVSLVHDVVEKLRLKPARSRPHPPCEEAVVTPSAVDIYQGEIANALLEWKPNLIKEPDAYGWTPLHCAARCGNVETVKKLLERDKSVAYIAANGDEGNTALHIAAAVGDVSVFEELLSYCPDCWEMVNSNGQNILHIAAYYERELATDFIFTRPWVTHLINWKDNEGNTPSHVLASKRGIPRAMIIGINKFLEEYPGSDIYYVVNNENRTPLDQGRPRVRQDRERIIKWKTGIEQRERGIEERKRQERTGGMAKTHIIVATLVATISFAASFTIPGGYNQEGPDEGRVVLVKDAAFKTFVITNTVAVICSTASVLIFLSTSLFNLDDEGEKKATDRYLMAPWLVIIALFAMTIAFVTGTYAVLGHSLGLAIPTCVIACSSFVIYVAEFTNLIRRLIRINSGRLAKIKIFLLNVKNNILIFK
ncbi:hypothetical protein Vadar_011921 [Vaccinium darrowii]|uniref:Uncharacterized protein n=1 Tax=Vaccinium darrowii TaxID=229202 RepID=A0ACB7XPY9_9ERIC|nr:hypothetical protein Vadar_011921 [Vaccinium darrowii]